VILSFLIYFLFFLCTNRFSIFYHQSVFYFSPPSLGLVTHFLRLSFFDYPFHLPDLLQPGCFPACLFAFVVASVASVRFWVSWTDQCCGRSAALLTHGQHHTRTQAIKHVCGGFPLERPVRPGNILSFSPSTSPLFPLWSRP
jgi:hypothetical protein